MITRFTKAAASLSLSAALLTACEASEEAAPTPTTNPQDAFWQALESHCGNAYVGQLVSDDAADADFAGAAMVMHVSECSDERIAIPFHVELESEDGARTWDRSRTWLITRTDTGLRLKHDHRHKDGETDAVTLYGGDTADAGSASAQSFPVDDFSITMFEREDLSASVTNIWTVEVEPAQAENPTFAYQLQRTVEGGAPEDRFFRVEFDLSQKVETPPAAWGHE